MRRSTLAAALAALIASVAVALAGYSGALGTLGAQNANNVAITGGAIDGTPVGNTTPAAVTGTSVRGTISSSGNVGNISAAGLNILSGAYDLKLGIDTSTTYGANGASWIQSTREGSANTPLVLNPNGGPVQFGASGLYYDANGRVGIGNTAPAQPLDVTGSGRVSGNLGVGGLTYRSTAPGVSAAGSTQGTATALTLELNVITTAASGSGVQLAAWSGNSATAAQQQVWNRGANALLVYPPSGAQIEAGAANAAVSLAVGAHATFTCTSAAQCWQAP